jgi:hypothetical protein
VGVNVGLAWLSKPPVMGAFFFAALGVHSLCAERHRTLTARVRGPLLALAVGVGVAAPWYLLLASRLGADALGQLFFFNSVTRAWGSKLPLPYDPFYYGKLVLKSSLGFALLGPALIVAVLRMAAGPQRQKWGLLILYPAVLLLALSLARNQSITYLYPAFPLACVLVAGLFVEPLPAWPGWLTGRRPFRIAAECLAGLLAVLVVLHDARQIRPRFADRQAYPPWDVYQRVLPVLDRHEGRIILFGFLRPDLECVPFDPMFVFERLYYQRRMPHVLWIDRLAELRQALADGKPALVILPQPAPVGSLRERGLAEPPEAQTVMRTGWYTHALLTFHGARDRFVLGDLFHPVSP